MQVQTSSESDARQICESAVRAFLDSACVRKSNALRNLVEYLWLHRDEDLSEFRIATEGLGRKADFDPKSDATARVQLLRVRQKLKEYYESEGKGATTRLVLPPGSHKLVIESVRPGGPPSRKLTRMQALPWALAGLFAVIAVLALASRFGSRVETPAPGGFQSLPSFWREFTANRKPVRIVLPKIAFFRWPHNSIKIRDTRVNRFDQLSESPELIELMRRWGTPEIMGNYTSAPDALAAIEIVNLLSRFGVEVSAIGSREADLDPKGAYNRVLLGNGRTSEYIGPLLKDLNFEPTEDFGFRNLSPRPGEPALFRRVEESRSREVVPGLIYHPPAREGEGETLVVLSENKQSLTRLLASKSGMSEFERALMQAGSPRAFELLVVAEIDSARLVSSRLAAVRAVSASR